MSYVKITGFLAGMAALTACNQTNEATFGNFYRTAGSQIDDGIFGGATQNNTLVQTGSENFTISLQRRFAAEVPSTVNFEFNKADLDESARAILMEQANWIKQFPEVRFRVYGHTDLVGSDAYNKSLGLQRARTVVNFLVGQGISRKRLEAVVSFGETQPVVATEDRERRNRRTVTEVTGFVASNPLVLDGKYAQIIYRDYIASAKSETVLTHVQGLDDASGTQ